MQHVEYTQTAETCLVLSSLLVVYLISHTLIILNVLMIITVLIDLMIFPVCAGGWCILQLSLFSYRLSLSLQDLASSWPERSDILVSVEQ